MSALVTILIEFEDGKENGTKQINQEGTGELLTCNQKVHENNSRNEKINAKEDNAQVTGG